jgi:DNA-directed RNA polymerase specialized sigma24 family protein
VLSKSNLKIEAHYYQHYMELALNCLSEKERQAITLRFLNPHTIAQVANYLKMSWDEADRLIDHAVEKMREHLTRSVRLNGFGEFDEKLNIAK